MFDNALIRLVITNLGAQMNAFGVGTIATEDGLNIATELDEDILTDGSGQANPLYGSIPIKQAYQPTRQGVNTVPTIYLYKLFDERIGSPRRRSRWAGAELVTEDLDGIVTEDGRPITTDGGQFGEMGYEEMQQYATHFQLSALATQDPANVESLTASDILNYATAAIQGSAFMDALRAADVGVLRVGQIRNPYFVDDRDRFEASPSFDFILTHKQVIVATAPVVETIETQIIRV